MSDRSPSPIAGPLAGITIVDLTRVLAGPYCTMVLSDLGARIIKVEHPDGGDDARHIGPFVSGKSAYFTSVNRGKESIALDLKSKSGKETLFALLETADVLVENYRPGTMEKLGIGWDILHQRFPSLIYAAASGFGHSGPYSERPAYDMVVQGMGGIMSLTGHEGAPPTRVGTSIGDITAGLFTAIGITSALYHRNLTGEPQKIDVSMLDCQVALLENAIARYTASGEVPGPIGARHPSITPFQAFHAKDGYLIIAAGNDSLFAKLAKELGAPDLPQDPRFTNNHLRCENVHDLARELEKLLEIQNVDDWLTQLQGAGIPCGPINNVEQVLNDPQVLSRNMVVQVEDDDLTDFIVAGNPIKSSIFPDPTIRNRAPDLDGDRENILKSIETKAGQQKG